jgi:ABC-type transport system substrate-binding protein
MNRERYIKDLFYSNYVMSKGTINVNSVYASPKNKPLLYDPKKARELLREAGWTKVGSDGVLTRDGQRFEFEMLIDNPALQRFLTIYQEDLKQMGIKMNIRTVDWTTSIKLRDDWQFDATLVARTQDVDPSDFAVLWGSKDADTKGSANNTGYKNPEIDKLAQQIDETFDKAKRIPLVRKLDETLVRDQPMGFTWEQTYLRVGYWNRFAFPGKGYFNYSHWRDIYEYWWYDAEKDAKLKKAMQSGEPLS